MYFGNLLSFIFVMLIYYGLLIIISIAVLVHWYDYTYNYEEFMSNIISTSASPGEFKSPEDIQKEQELMANFHLGHKHW
jgi:hypothetical protein